MKIPWDESVVAVRRRVAGSMMLGLASVIGCAPTLDWRELRIPSADVVALFPCRPASQTRRLTLVDEAVTMTLHVCSAGGSTFALTFTDVTDPRRVADALRALRGAAAANIGTRSVDQRSAWVVPGMTPAAEGGQWRLSGHLPDGTPVQVAMALAAHGTTLVQVSVTGAVLRPAEIDPFLEAIRFGS